MSSNTSGSPALSLVSSFSVSVFHQDIELLHQGMQSLSLFWNLLYVNPQRPA